MKTIILIIGLLAGINLWAQNYLMPHGDTLDVIQITYGLKVAFTMDVGQFSRIEPVVVNTLNPTGDYFLPSRCLYDTDMTSVYNILKNRQRYYYIISQQKLVSIPKKIEP